MANLVQSTTLKLLGVAALTLLCAVPLALVNDLVSERQGRLLEAESDIARSQGRAQLLVPPILQWTQRRTVLGSDGTTEIEEIHSLAPASVRISARLEIERRYRGIFEVPVYTVHATLRGTFTPGTDTAPMPAAEGLRLVLPIADLRGVRALTRVRLGGRDLVLRSLGTRTLGVEGLAAVLSTPLAERAPLPFEIDLVLSGTRELAAWPLADDTQVELDAAWGSPSFSGAFLPVSRTIESDRFSAQWSVLAVNRDLPQHWVGDADASALDSARFGVALYEPLGVYRLNERTLKYGLLFVALTFGLFFLAEITGGARLHPVQYLLVGAALAVFYVVLLALSEHLGFATAYALAACALTAIVGAWGTRALGSRMRGIGLAAWLAILYAFLFLMVRSEDHALLIGALGALGMVAAALYLTRGIDWYALRAGAPPPPSVA